MWLRSILILLFQFIPGAFAKAEPASSEQTFLFQGIERQYVLVRPANKAGPVPIVVALHGLGESVGDLRRSWTMDAVAERDGCAVLDPMALGGRWSYVAARAVPLPDASGTVDDIGFILGLLDWLSDRRILDPARIYVSGISNGGLMAWSLACQASDRFAAIAPIITGMVDRQTEQCNPSRLAPLLVIAGTEDWVQSYDGAMGPNYRLLSIPETLEFWRRQRACVGFDMTAAPQRQGVADTTRAVLVIWKDCKDSSPQRFWRIEGGGHSLPSMRPLSDREQARGPHGARSQAIETAEEIWRFFATARR